MLTAIALVAASFVTVATLPAYAATSSWPHQLVAGLSTPNAATGSPPPTEESSRAVTRASTARRPVVGAVTTRGDKGYELLMRGGGHFDFGNLLVRRPAPGR